MAAPPTTGVSTNNNKISVNLHLSPTPVLSGNAFDETKENSFYQQDVDEEENNFISNNYGAGKKKNPFRASLRSSRSIQKLKVVLTYFQPMFDLCINQVVDFYYQNV